MKSYLIEIKSETITPVTVQASSSDEALEKVLHNEGVAGDSYHGEISLLSIRVVEE